MSSKLYTPTSLKASIFSSLKEPFYKSEYATHPITIEGRVIKAPAIYGPAAYFMIEDDEKVQINIKVPKSLSYDIKRGDLIRLLGTVNLNSKTNAIDYDIIFSAFELLNREISHLEVDRSNLLGELWSAGYFSRNKPFPDFTQMDYCKVAIITSGNESAHAFADIEGILKNLPFYKYQLVTVNLASAENISQGIIESSKNHDIIILTRGGGDLTVFDERVVLDAIFHTSGCFIISAVGHAKDKVLADMGADHIARTPTDAARFLADKYSAHIASQQFLQLQKNNKDLNNSVNSLYKLLEQNKQTSDSLLKLLHKAQRIKVFVLIGFGISLIILLKVIIKHGFSWILG